jgi:hypothetical protein
MWRVIFRREFVPVFVGRDSLPFSVGRFSRQEWNSENLAAFFEFRQHKLGHFTQRFENALAGDRHGF